MLEHVTNGLENSVGADVNVKEMLSCVMVMVMQQRKDGLHVKPQTKQGDCTPFATETL